MNDSELNNMIKKAQEMIKNNQVPPEIKDMASKINNSYTENPSNSGFSSGFSNRNNTNTNSSRMPDAETMIKLKSMLSGMNMQESNNMNNLGNPNYPSNSSPNQMQKMLKIMMMLFS